MKPLSFVTQRVKVLDCPDSGKHEGQTGVITDIDPEQNIATVQLDSGEVCNAYRWEGAKKSRKVPHADRTLTIATREAADGDNVTRERTIAFSFGQDESRTVNLTLPGDLSLPEAYAIAAVFIHYLTQWKEGK